jgi:hypothetical protein
MGTSIYVNKWLEVFLPPGSPGGPPPHIMPEGSSPGGDPSKYTHIIKESFTYKLICGSHMLLNGQLTPQILG